MGPPWKLYGKNVSKTLHMVSAIERQCSEWWLVRSGCTVPLDDAEVELNWHPQHSVGCWNFNRQQVTRHYNYCTKHTMDIWLNIYCFRVHFNWSRMGRSAKQNFVYVPHKRRGPISAEFKSPGPAAFNLPGTIGSKWVQLLKDLD